MTSLPDIVSKMKHKKIAVIGDLMLDCYISGSVERISPEAPIPILCEKEYSSCLGGAANVMRNIVSLGGEAFAFGVVGNDEHGIRVIELLKDAQVDCSGILQDFLRRTTVKTRIMASGQQLLRLDREDILELRAEQIDFFHKKILNIIRNREVDAIIFEDYAKGVLYGEWFQAVIDEAKIFGILTLLDPNPRNPMRVKNITLMKPNRVEAGILAGAPTDTVDWDKLHEIACKIKFEWEADNVLISLAADGMMLLDSQGHSEHIPTAAKEVYDVSGAGDTVMAATALGLVAGTSVRTAVKIGNLAAGIVVAKLGTAMVSAQELLAASREQSRQS